MERLLESHLMYKDGGPAEESTRARLTIVALSIAGMLSMHSILHVDARVSEGSLDLIVAPPGGNVTGTKTRNLIKVHQRFFCEVSPSSATRGLKFKHFHKHSC